VLSENWRNHAIGVIPSGVIAGFHCILILLSVSWFLCFPQILSFSEDKMPYFCEIDQKYLYILYIDSLY